MTTETLDICGTALTIKEYSDQRVVTLKDVDRVHQRPDGTAKRNFNANKNRFIENEDYFIISYSEFGTKFVQRSKGGNPNNNVVLLTESGYLMLVKSFTDDLAWRVQRGLVNSYFKREKKAVRIVGGLCAKTRGAYKRYSAGKYAYHQGNIRTGRDKYTRCTHHYPTRDK